MSRRQTERYIKRRQRKAARRVAWVFAYLGRWQVARDVTEMLCLLSPGARGRASVWKVAP